MTLPMTGVGSSASRSKTRTINNLLYPFNVFFFLLKEMRRIMQTNGHLKGGCDQD